MLSWHQNGPVGSWRSPNLVRQVSQLEKTIATLKVPRKEQEEKAKKAESEELESRPRYKTKREREQEEKEKKEADC